MNLTWKKSRVNIPDRAIVYAVFAALFFSMTIAEAVIAGGLSDEVWHNLALLTWALVATVEAARSVTAVTIE